MTKIDIHSYIFLHNLTKVMAGKKYRLYTFRDYLELQHIDNDDYSVIIKEDSWKGVNLFIEHKDTVHFKKNYITETRLLASVEEYLKVIDGIVSDLVEQIQPQEDVTMVLGGLNFCKKKFSDSLVEGLKEIAEEYGVTFKQKANSLFLDTDSGEGYAMVFTTGGNRLHVNTVVNGYGNPGRTIPCPNNDAVFNTVKSLLEDRLGIKPKTKYANLEMMKRSKDFIISEEGEEILVDFVAFYIPYYATIKDGEITYSINVIDAEEEHIKLDMDKINQLKEVCEFIIG